MRQARILKRFMQAALVGDKGLSDEPKQPGEGAPDEDLDSEIQAVEQMRGRDGQIALKAKACKVGVRTVEKRGGTWKSLRLEVLRMRVLDRLRWLRWRGLCSHAGSCSGWKRLRSKTKANSSGSSSATTNEQSAKCQKDECQRVLRRIASISAVDPSRATTPNLAASQGVKWAQKSAAKGQAHLDEKSAKCQKRADCGASFLSSFQSSFVPYGDSLEGLSGLDWFLPKKPRAS